METDTVTLKCEASKPNQPSVWHRNQQSITPDETHQISVDGNVHRLTIVNVDTTDAAEYACVIGDAKTTGKLHVQGRFTMCMCLLFVLILLVLLLRILMCLLNFDNVSNQLFFTFHA